MHERATYESGGAGHLDLEDLAALIDGTLPPEEAAGARAHLARCERCLALFTETASFLREDVEGEEAGEGEVPTVVVAAAAAPAAAALPFVPRQAPQPLPRRRRWRWAGAAAATAAVLALAVAAGIYRRSPQATPPQVDMARLLASAAVRQAAAVLPWAPSQRGANTGPDAGSLAAFRLAVELADLEVALSLGDRDRAMAAASHVNSLLASPGVIVGQATKRFFHDLPGRLQSGASAASLAGELAAARRELEGYLSRPHYDLGRFAEAGRLAAAAGAQDFFAAPDTRRFPAALRGELGTGLDPRAGEALAEIAKTLDRRTLNADDYKSLGVRFKTILETYYPV